jgi:hypothetical protein
MLIVMGFSPKSDEHLTFGPLTRSRENIANLHMGPFSAPGSFDVPLVELGGNSIVANATPLKRPNDPPTYFRSKPRKPGWTAGCAATRRYLPPLTAMP